LQLTAAPLRCWLAASVWIFECFKFGMVGGNVISVRYLVKDVESAVKFYTTSLGFELEQQFGPAMAIVRKGSMKLWLAGPPSSAAQAMPDGRKPEPGGWNRFVLQVDDISATVAQLKKDGVTFRNDFVKGPGGTQILCEDPSGNAIELFQPPN